jgi:hypothetical protein
MNFLIFQDEIKSIETAEHAQVVKKIVLNLQEWLKNKFPVASSDYCANEHPFCKKQSVCI